MTTNISKLGVPATYDHNSSPTIRGYRSVSKNDLHVVKRAAQVLSVESGCAWVTFDGKDIIMDSGEQITLVPGHDRAIISALGKTPLVYAIG